MPSVLPPQFEQFIRRMPKVELHLHLEGAITPRTLLELARRNGLDLGARSEAEVAALFHYRDFGAFLTVFMDLARAIVYGEDFERLAYELGRDLSEQCVRYAEVMISPMQHINRGVDLREAIEGAMAGFARAERDGGVQVRLVLDYGRGYGTEPAWGVLEVARAMQPRGVVGWSIGGNEIGHPPEPFAPLFAAARAAGLGVMAHAGEVVGPASVWGAINTLGITRLGHGIRAVDDPDLVVALRERGVVLDICPTSNLLTGAVPSWEAHPLPRLRAAGVPLTINSDDPTFFRTNLTEEYRRAAIHFGFTTDDLSATVLTAATASFLPPQGRAALRHALAAELDALRAELAV